MVAAVVVGGSRKTRAGIDMRSSAWLVAVRGRPLLRGLVVVLVVDAIGRAAWYDPVGWREGGVGGGW